MPSFSTRPGGNIRDANARRKMVLNSASRPPIPMDSNLKSGAMIELAAGLRLEALRFSVVFGSLKKLICVCEVRMPRDLLSDDGGDEGDFCDRSISCTVFT